MLLILNKTVSQAAFGCLLLIVQHLCDLLDTMPRHWSPGTSHAPFTAHATDLREGFYLPAGSKNFLAAAIQPQSQQGFMLIFETQPWPDYFVERQQSTNIVVGSIYVPKASFEVRVPQAWNLAPTSFERAFLKVPCNDNRLSWRVEQAIESCKLKQIGRSNLITAKLRLHNSVVQ